MGTTVDGIDPVVSAKPILERFSLAGRTALVTGGGRGIGRALAFALGQAGAAVALADILPENAAAVARELEKRGIRAMAIEADVTDSASVNRMVTRVREEWGGLTIAVNNAGVGFWQASEKLTDEEWARVLNVNLNAVFFCCRAEAGVMLEAGYGKIINIASMSGSIVNTPQRQAAYNTSKAGVMHLTKSLAAEWATRGVRVNSISPGYTRTPLLESRMAASGMSELRERWLERIPMGRMGEVTDLQGAAVFLASEVSDMMTGSDLIIDGGYCCW